MLRVSDLALDHFSLLEFGQIVVHGHVFLIACYSALRVESVDEDESKGYETLLICCSMEAHQGGLLGKSKHRFFDTIELGMALPIVVR